MKGYRRARGRDGTGGGAVAARWGFHAVPFMTIPGVRPVDVNTKDSPQRKKAANAQQRKGRTQVFRGGGVFSPALSTVFRAARDTSPLGRPEIESKEIIKVKCPFFPYRKQES